jgi:hypothetical protein
VHRGVLRRLFLRRVLLRRLLLLLRLSPVPSRAIRPGWVLEIDADPGRRAPGTAITKRNEVRA